MALNAPMLTCIPSARACDKRGEFSIKLLNSSPRKTPDANACDICRITDAASPALAPDIRNDWARVSVSAVVLRVVPPICSIALLIREKIVALASKLVPVRKLIATSSFDEDK